MMKRIIVILAAAVLLSCGVPRRSLVLMTYNVQHGTEGIASVVESASFAAIQELDSCNRRTPVYQLEKLSEDLDGRPFHFARAFPFAGGAYGNGVLSREPLVASFTVPLPQADGAEPRSMAVVETLSLIHI